MKAPEKIYMPNELLSEEWQRHIEGQDTAYIRKDIVDETIKTAEDHAYFAGQEKFREKLIEWLEGRMTKEEATEGFVGGYDIALKDVVDKINSM